MKLKISVISILAAMLVLTACTNRQDSGTAKQSTPEASEKASTTLSEAASSETTSSETASSETISSEIETIDNREHFPQEMRDMETSDIVRDMGIGINLGNTFEACGDWITGNTVQSYETAWGSPVITKKMIEGYAAEGFGALRIPVAWSNMMASDYTINPEYMARIKEIADWTIDSNMYAIINIHWDGGWWDKFPTEKEKCMEKYTSIWKQISNEFCDYGDKLIFESLNEEGCWDSVWNHYNSSAAGKQKAYDLLNEINQTFVDLVRSSGCNNQNRHLLIAGYATDITLTCDDCFKMPKDPQNRCAVSVHYYTPAAYCIITEDTSWAKAQTEWGSDADIAELDKYMKMLYDTFVTKGVPVIIGEFGVAMDNKDKANATLFLKTVAQKAYDYNMCPVLWDTTGSFSFYNRYTCSMSEFPELKEAFNNIIK